MAQEWQGKEMPQQQQRERGSLFGIPLGGLGLFSSLLIGAATAFMAFFAATFAGIVGIMIYNSTTHHSVDYALSYERGGLIAGALTLVLAWGYLGTQWVRRITSH
jgi:hypothetical protein